MARTRRRTSFRKSKRWNPGRRSKSTLAAAPGYVGVPRATFRKKTIWNMARRGAKVHRFLNPSGSVLRDGTSVSIDGDSVCLVNAYGESYDYDNVSRSAIARLRRATSFAQASKMLNSTSVLRSINPKRGRKSKRRSSYRTSASGTSFARKQIRSLSKKRRKSSYDKAALADYGAYVKKAGRGRKSSRRARVSRRSSRKSSRRSSKSRFTVRRGTRGRRGGRWTERRARKKARFYQGKVRRSHKKLWSKGRDALTGAPRTNPRRRRARSRR